MADFGEQCVICPHDHVLSLPPCTLGCRDAAAYPSCLWGEGRVTTWKSHQFIVRTHRDEQQSTSTFTNMDNLVLPIRPIHIIGMQEKLQIPHQKNRRPDNRTCDPLIMER